MSVHSPAPASSPRRKSTIYETYLRTEELLSLQKPAADRLHPDELTFQVTHQTFELWWKVTTEQLTAAIEQLSSRRIAEAARTLRRAVSAQAVVMQAIRQLEFVAPADFLVIRSGLGDGSGADSPGFRAILRITPALWDAFTAALDRERLSLFDLYAAPHDHTTLYDCAESLVDFDEAFHLFRATHLKLAQRNLGLHAVGTGGTPMPALERTLRDLLFPPLWEVRDQLLQHAQQRTDATGAAPENGRPSGHGS
jgi:tryptophan 2,3-dioxygenase